ncbi:nitronate monooxygenase family protein [Acidiferrimicrobium sp. IK]|uniref:NAD(P)H-dependent flavin oxidoreductase n=1 Tax=Acidiferrimicrobium sp. IK TaxID=2871700 RepID=UPI0021CB047E|nr:nitronate monooxygenase family protein [Acidiferrimicrobium sp. IK]MCU4185931.1 nitronate monooxygenase family protein [Acidiferrimicrobium sp. IK]
MTTLPTPFTELVGIDYPIVQEGMGPFKTSKLAAAVSEAGGLGTVSMPGMTTEPSVAARTLREHIEETASLTRKPFAVNVPVGRAADGEVLPVSEAYIRAVVEARKADPVIARQLRVLTTSAGFPGEFRDLIADAGLIHMHKVGSTRQAVKAERLGVDVVIASGYEMGGHTHTVPMHTFVLVPNVTEAVSIPVLLSGGARDGRTLAAALCLGAAGVAMGTRFIASEDNRDWHRATAKRIVDAAEGDDTIFPGVYSPARGLRSAGVERLTEMMRSGATDDELLAYKDQALIRAEEDGDLDSGILPAGQVASGIHDIVSVAHLVPEMAAEAAAVLHRLSAAAQLTRST